MFHRFAIRHSCTMSRGQYSLYAARAITLSIPPRDRDTGFEEQIKVSGSCYCSNFCHSSPGTRAKLVDKTERWNGCVQRTRPDLEIRIVIANVSCGRGLCRGLGTTNVPGSSTSVTSLERQRTGEQKV
ncbi:uncharacterized protein LOC118514457 [Anopheles stephensi]|uniref:uncharacterized protein LOC118514457 n=1 Tax=Anopheles stephensi TaxID=30069 RepID=UPI001658B444|nr:uncharacterized protein LOC118514457 [Anopheles stephensi]